MDPIPQRSNGGCGKVAYVVDSAGHKTEVPVYCDDTMKIDRGDPPPFQDRHSVNDEGNYNPEVMEGKFSKGIQVQ